MQKVILFGTGKIARRIYEKGIYNIVAVIDNKSGGEDWNGIPYIGIDEYKQSYKNINIKISTAKFFKEIRAQLISEGIFNFSLAAEACIDPTAYKDTDIEHGAWPQYLEKLCDKKGFKVLEIGSRVQTGANWRGLFKNADYVGFDYYEGDNVDVVGDAHHLSSYFNEKFDLIFSSAVFEHIAMPWVVSMEIIKLLNIGGYVFIETHYSFSRHEFPWHFFQFSENALNVLFPEKFGIHCIKKGVCNPLQNAEFSEYASPYLKGRMVGALYCHSEFLGRKIREVSEDCLNWADVRTPDVVNGTMYPKHDWVPQL